MSKSERQSSIDHHRNYCIHYDPRESKTGCSAGMDKEKIQCVPTPSSNVGRMIPWGPCIAGHTLESPCSHCPKWQRHTLMSAEKYADDVEKSIQRMMIVDPVIEAWRTKPPMGKSEVIQCPACNGRLHLSQAASNGHVRAKCKTNECVNFIE